MWTAWVEMSDVNIEISPSGLNSAFWRDLSGTCISWLPSVLSLTVYNTPGVMQKRSSQLCRDRPSRWLLVPVMSPSPPSYFCYWIFQISFKSKSQTCWSGRRTWYCWAIQCARNRRQGCTCTGLVRRHTHPARNPPHSRPPRRMGHTTQISLMRLNNDKTRQKRIRFCTLLSRIDLSTG